MKRLASLSFLVMFLIGTDTFLVSPMLPALSNNLHFPLEHGGWLVSAYAIGYCAMALFSGPISDHMNRRSVLIAGMLLFSLATAACGLATSFWMLFTLRLLTGVCAAVGSPQIWAIIPQITPANRIASVMAAPTAGLTIATLLGVPVGSFLSATTTSVPFFAVGAFALLVSLALLLLFPAVPRLPQAEAPEHNTRGGAFGLINSYRTLFSGERTAGYFLAYLVFQTGNFAIMTFIATWFSKSFHLNQQQIGFAVMVIGVGNTLGALLGPALLARVRHGLLFMIGFDVYIAGYAILGFSASIVAACAILFVTYLTSGLMFPILIERLQSLTTTQRGTVSTLSNVTMYAGSTIAGFIGGPLLVRLPGFWGISLLALSAMLVSLALWAKSGALRN